MTAKSFAHTQQQQADWQNTFALNHCIIMWVGGVTQTDTQAQYDNGFGTTLR
jgi:hypothetical protein